MTVEQALPHANEMTVEQGLPHVAVERGLTNSDNSAPSSTSTRKSSPKRRRRRLKLRRTPSPSELLVTQTVNALEYVEGGPRRQRTLEVAIPPKDAKSIIQLPGHSWKHFLRDLKASEIEQICPISDADSVSRMSWDALRESGNPVYETVREFADIFPDKIPAELPADRGVHHEIDLAPGAKRAMFARASLRIQTPIPRKDMVLDSMSDSVIYSAIDLTDGFYQILMRECDVPLTAVSTPSGMLWEWLVMPQGLKNAPATFNRMVSHVLRPLRDFAPSYFDDIFVHSRAEGDLSAVDVHLQHLRQVFQVMRDNKLYANLKKCIFCAPEIPVLGCYVCKNGVRADPEKVTSICPWLTPTSPTELRQWLGMANYLHKYTKNYAGLIQPLSSLLKKDATWDWRPEHREAFDAVKTSVASAPILMLPDGSKPFHVVCDASDFAIRCALMQFDDGGRERIGSYQSHREAQLPQTFAVYTNHASLQTAMKSPHLSQRMARWLSFFAEYNFVVHYKPGKNNILADALSRRPGYDPRNSLDHQQANDEDDEDPCASCVASGLNLMNVSPELTLRAEIANAYEYDTTYSKIMNYFRSPSDVRLGEMSRSQQSQIDRYRLDDN
ncbi:polyprotein, partial [Phytophthora megakarya]